MKKSKLIDIFSTFKKEEIKLFRDFIKSPFFNKKKEVFPFYELLVKYYPDFPEEKIERHQVFKILYPNSPYNEKQLGYLMSYLSKLVERFISYQKFQSDTFMPEYYLASAFIERNLYKYYLQENKKVQTALSKQEGKSSSHFLKNYLIVEVALQYYNFQIKEKRKHDQILQIAVDKLDLFYLTTKLEYSCEMANQIKVLGADYQIHFTSNLESQIQHSEFIKEPLINVYFQIYQMLQSEVTTEKINSLREIIRKEASNFSDDETQKIYKYAINFCLQMLRKGKYEFMEQAFELYIDGIEQGIFYDNGYLSPWIYTNAIKLGIALKRYEYIEKFIKDKNPKLPKELQENSLHYNLAELYYSRKQFDKAIEHLNQVKFSNTQVSLGAREIFAKVYYETDAEESLLSLIASFSIFLKRNKNISENVKRAYLNFCDLLNQLMRKNPKKLSGIRKKIEETNPVTSKTWLLQTCDKIMKEVGL